MTSVQSFKRHAREKLFGDGYVVLVDVLAFRSLHEERVPVPRAFARLIWETAKVRDRRPDDIERDLKLERSRSSVEVGQEECTYNRVLQGCAVGTAIKGGSVLSMGTHRLIKC
jgi:hypothetical protein